MLRTPPSFNAELICQCFAVAERRIRRLVREGAGCADAVALACGAGDGCGACRAAVEAIVRCEVARLASGADPAQSE